MSDSELKKMGKWMAAALGETPQDQVMEERAAFLDQVESGRRRSRRPVIYALAAAATLLIALGGYTFFEQSGTHSVVPVGDTPVEGHRLVAGTGGEEVIQFDGGSKFVVESGSTARVISSNADEVIVGLQEGSVRCSINGNGHTRWMVRAGGYQVLVTGTRFVVRFEPEALFLQVDVTEGSVQVSGDALNADGIRLAAGENISVEGSRVEITRNENDEEKVSGRTSVRRRGKRHKRVHAIETRVEEAAPEAPAALPYEELWREGKIARREGRSDEAYQLLQELRDRFPGKPYARQATFLLGRIALESRKNPALAKRWFEAYLLHSPSGALAEESMGRLITICRQTGNSCARTYARGYLATYPNGAFAELAQSVLE